MTKASWRRRIYSGSAYIMPLHKVAGGLLSEAKMIKVDLTGLLDRVAPGAVFDNQVEGQLH